MSRGALVGFLSLIVELLVSARKMDKMVLRKKLIVGLSHFSLALTLALNLAKMQSMMKNKNF